MKENDFNNAAEACVKIASRRDASHGAMQCSYMEHRDYMTREYNKGKPIGTMTAQTAEMKRGCLFLRP